MTDFMDEYKIKIASVLLNLGENKMEYYNIVPALAKEWDVLPKQMFPLKIHQVSARYIRLFHK